MTTWRKVRPGTLLLIGALAIIVLYTVISTGTGLIRLYRPMTQQQVQAPAQIVPAQPQPQPQAQPVAPERPAPSEVPAVPPAAKPAPKSSKPVDDVPMQRQARPAPKPITTVATRSAQDHTVVTSALL